VDFAAGNRLFLCLALSKGTTNLSGYSTGVLKDACFERASDYISIQFLRGLFMLFNSPIFLFLFLPLVLAGYYLISPKLRNILLFFFSVVFYAFGEPIFVCIVLASAMFDWFIGFQIGREGTKDSRRNFFLIVSVLQNLLILVFFKYSNFLVNNANFLFGLVHGPSIQLSSIVLPIGVSFVVFEKITYLVDVRRGQCRPEKHLIRYMLYVFFFPKLLAGPIIKFHDINEQLSRRNADWEGFIVGFIRFSFGLAKKVFIADTMGEVADFAFQIPIDQLPFGTAWLGIIAYTIQIYFDFGGYSDMAIGLARMFGFRIMENFNVPYVSQNITEFWRRWHISLSTWIKSYLYIPLGGNRVSQPRLYFNLVLCFFLSGLWHGANWSFVIWGLYQGVFMVFDRVFWIKAQARLPRIFKIVINMAVLIVGWTIFRGREIGYSLEYLWVLVSPFVKHAPSATNTYFITLNVIVFLIAGIIGSFAPECQTVKKLSQSHPWLAAAPYMAFVLFVLSAAKVTTMTFNPFLYFRF